MDKEFRKRNRIHKESRDSVKIVEMDELHSYISLKKTIFGSGLLLIDLESGTSTLLSVREGQRQE